MKKSYVKSLKEYKGPFELSADKILSAMKRYKDSKKKPTSVALDETTIRELKAIAEKQGIHTKYSSACLFWMVSIA